MDNFNSIIKRKFLKTIQYFNSKIHMIGTMYLLSNGYLSRHIEIELWVVQYLVVVIYYNL